MDNDFTHLRGPVDATAQRLTPEAIRWLGELPENKRPAKLATQFARIANKIALLWSDDQGTAAYLDSLMFDERGNRKGFPMAVATELGTLRELVSAKIDARAGKLRPQAAVASTPVPSIEMRAAPKR